MVKKAVSRHLSAGKAGGKDEEEEEEATELVTLKPADKDTVGARTPLERGESAVSPAEVKELQNQIERQV